MKDELGGGRRGDFGLYYGGGSCFYEVGQRE